MNRDELIAECQKALQFATCGEVEPDIHFCAHTKEITDRIAHSIAHSPRASRAVLELMEELGAAKKQVTANSIYIDATEAERDAAKAEVEHWIKTNDLTNRTRVQEAQERDALRAKLKVAEEALEQCRNLLSIVNVGAQPDFNQMNWYDARSALPLPAAGNAIATVRK